MANAILTDVRRVVRNAHQHFNGEQIFNTNIRIVISNDKDIRKELIRFLRRLQQSIKRVKEAKVADGYINLFNTVLSMRVEF